MSDCGTESLSSLSFSLYALLDSAHFVEQALDLCLIVPVVTGRAWVVKSYVSNVEREVGEPRM